jgi:hypothetical protein
VVLAGGRERTAAVVGIVVAINVVGVPCVEG